MSGFPNPFIEIPKAIFKSLKRNITRREKCFLCDTKRKLKDLEKNYLGQWKCKDEYGCLLMRSQP
jgi:hypothetical protein